MTVKRIARVLSASFAIAVALALAATAILFLDWEERAFHLESIDVDAIVLRDGSMLVHEQVVYRFTGADSQPYSVASRDFESGPFNWRITQIAAYENGERRETIWWDPLLFEWDIYPAASGTRTFDLVYRVEGAVLAWADVAELYWNWIGTTSPEVGSWSAQVRVPDGDGEIRAWAHGPLDGEVVIDDPFVRSEVGVVPAGRHVDNRVVLPVDRFEMTPSSEPALARIIAEEQRAAHEANLDRARAERNERWRSSAEVALTWGMAPLIALALGAFGWVWRKWGKDPPRPDDIGDYWREVPDDPPAVGAALLDWRSVSTDAFSATLLDLARRGHMRIEEVQVKQVLRRPRIEYRFVKTEPAAPDPLLPFEQRTLTYLFKGNRKSITQKQLVERSSKSQNAATSFWDGFRADVRKELDARHYLVRGNTIGFALHAVIVIVLLGLSVLAIAVGALVAGVIGITASIALVPLGILHRSRTPAGTRRDAKWRALRRYLRDFSRLDEAPSGHLALWDHYLVAATALGVAQQLLDGLRAKFPELAESTASSVSWYRPVTGSTPGSGFSGFSRSFGSTAVSSFTPKSSGSGSGGGFSSGGGGGGGGGGFGAR
jgi:uncharacterized membrane protein